MLEYGKYGYESGTVWSMILPPRPEELERGVQWYQKVRYDELEGRPFKFRPLSRLFSRGSRPVRFTDHDGVSPRPGPAPLYVVFVEHDDRIVAVEFQEFVLTPVDADTVPLDKSE